MPTEHSAPDARIRDERDPETGPVDLVGFVAAEEAVAEAERVPLLRRLSGLAGPLVRFALVGGVGFLVETAVFNGLMFTVLDPNAVSGGELWAKVVATLVAITTNWLGNRLWAFRHDRRTDQAKEGVEFFGVSLVGLLIGLLPIWFMGSALGLTDKLSLNLANIVGIGLGAIFRFACYRFWVYSPKRAGSRANREKAEAAQAEAERAAAEGAAEDARTR